MADILSDCREQISELRTALFRERASVPPVGERERRIAETIQDYLDCYDEADRCFGCDNDAGREHAEDCTEAPRIKEARAWADSILSSPAPDPASGPRGEAVSGTDVYEFLGRLADTDHRAEPVDTGFYQFPDPVASAFEHAQHVVEFLRWRDAREEWPSDGCFCYVVIQFGSEPFESGWLELRRGGFRNMKKVLVHDGPLSVTRWRYALGPCSCSALADPAKEG